MFWKLLSHYLFLTIAFSLFFNSYLAGQYTLYHTGTPYQFQFDSLPHSSRIQVKNGIWHIPEYRYYKPIYQKNKISSITARSKENGTIYYRKYNREGYLIEEIDHSLSPPQLPDNRGHHFYSYSNDHRVVFDSLIPDKSTVAVKHQYLFDTNFRILSHRIFSHDHLLPDNTQYSYDTNGNCIRIIGFYKNYTYDRSGSVQIIKDGDVVSMRSDTIQFQYEYRFNQISTLMRKDNTPSDVYGTTQVSIGPAPGFRMDGEMQIFDSLSRIIEIQSRGLTVQFFYKKNLIIMEMIYAVNSYGSSSSESSITEYAFYYDKHGHLKDVRYFSPAYPSGSRKSKVHAEKVHYKKDGLLINNSYGGKMIYEYYND